MSRTQQALLAFALLAAFGAEARTRAAAEAGATALVGGTVIVAPGREIADATLLLRDGRVEAVGAGLAIPEDARRIDCTGLTLWPGFVDAYVSLDRVNGKSDVKAKDGAPAAAATPTGRSASGSENPSVRPEVRAVNLLAPDAKVLEAFRAAGILAGNVVPVQGILRGRGVVTTFGSGEPGNLVIAESGDLSAAFDTSGEDGDSYPNSAMGATAVLRQAFLDAAWYRQARAHARTHARAPRVADDASLAALDSVVPPSRARLAFDCGNVLDALRAAEVAREAGLGLWLVGSGDEYRRLADVAALRLPIAVPLDYPAPPPATDADAWRDVPLATLRHWDLAPDNARFLEEAGLEPCFTTKGMADLSAVAARVRRSVARGLPESVALAMLTTRPAKLLGLESQLGTLEPGRLANVVVATGRPFAKGTEIRDAWVDGRRHVVSRPPEGALGIWDAKLRLGDKTVEGRLKIEASGGSFAWKAAPADEKPKSASLSEVVQDGASIRFKLEGSVRDAKEPFTLHAKVEGQELHSVGGTTGMSLEATRASGPDPMAALPKPEPRRSPPKPPGPINATDDFLLRGARVWTSAEAGILDSADVLVTNGRIAAVGPQLKPPGGCAVVEANGQNLTPGIFDEHSHAAIVGGVNEGTRSCTAEVRIGDVVNSETVNIYRLLAGGSTAAHLLHGSANCMGGQCQLIKLRWGASPSELKFEGAQPSIKFALGENVKQSNWGEKYTTRFPQTRMGVETFMRQKFLEAQSYRDRLRDWKKGLRKDASLPPRRDLQLDALVDILEGRISIHCHSYRQDEILMLMRVAEEFGFRVGTFTHVLEGYKVADEIARHGAGASSFTDWWGYKFEVYDAIPYNPALLWKHGVLTAINSDSTELARRLNLDAAKVVKWGGVPETEALKMVTLNPAKQCGVGDRVGSIEVGKDADLALWSASPLSTSSRCLKTWVDGKLWFDRENDVAQRAVLETERAALIERARAAQGDDDAKVGSLWRPGYLDAEQDCLDNLAVARREEVQ